MPLIYQSFGAASATQFGSFGVLKWAISGDSPLSIEQDISVGEARKRKTHSRQSLMRLHTRSDEPNTVLPIAELLLREFADVRRDGAATFGDTE